MKEIKFVDVGEGITEGHVQKWLVKDGDTVKEDQAVVQVETDKAVVNVPSPVDGIVKIMAPENSTVHVGDMIAYIGTAAELGSAGKAQPAAPQKQAASQPAKAVAQATAPAKTEKAILATPSVRKMAHELNVDISQVIGTGPNGRVIENDLRSFASKGTVQEKPVVRFSESLEAQHKEDIKRIPMSMTRKAIARNMELSWTIPRAVSMELIDATDLFNRVQKEKEAVMKQHNVKLTFLPFIIKATIEALKENPNFNASYDHEKLEIIRKNYYNIGIAAEAPDGLKVMVIRDADKKSIIAMAKELAELGQKVRDQTITIEEMKDSSFTISNIGSLGGGFLSVPMINYPDVAILGVHLIKDTPIVKDGKIVVGKVLPISISFDHRVVDGAEAVHFGNALKKYIEDLDYLEISG
ncbi:MAG TPA: dihydrolipoamide acetyltransferase family protein [Candidatus Acidoferrales bacterium]|nr:dihydrolipoamide acetyltransferase family protein [Candidatus Acidoferrales bacterium]